MRCAKCGTASTSGRKFCPECGTPFSSRCAKCGAGNSPTAKFCEDCGAPLRSSAAALAQKNDSPIRVVDTPASENLEGERKTVTALFADIKGSTELDAGPRSRGSARNCRSGAEADDRRGASLRRLRRAIDRRRHLRALRRAGRARGPSATRAVRGSPDAGGSEALFGAGCARRATCRSKRASA